MSNKQTSSAKIIKTVGKSAASELNFPFLAPIIDGSIARITINIISYGIQITEKIITFFLIEFGNSSIEIPYIQAIKAKASNP